MKLDTKSIIITVLFILVIFFVYKSYFSIDDSYKQDIERLKEQNKTLVFKRDSLNKKLDSIKTDFEILSKKDSLLVEQIKQSRDSVIKAKREVYKSKKDLEAFRKKIIRNKSKIDSLLNKTETKSDEELLQSLKNKLNQ